MLKCHNICSPLAGVLLICGLLVPRVEAQPIGDKPLISIVEPTFNETSSASTIYIGVRFGPGAETSTFEARLNGKEITSLFDPATQCGTAGPCDMRALVTDANLLNGTNIVTVDIAGPNDAEGSDRFKFQFESPGATGSSVSRFVSAVSVESVRLPEGANANDVNSYEIVVGPGPDFPKTIYTPANLTCLAGINSMQVLVLDRTTLNPEQTVGSGSGQNCFGDAAALSTFLTGLPAGDLVIMNSFLGLMSNLNTTRIGGTNYSASSIQPRYYNAIGVVGAPAGTAHESYRATRADGRASLAPLVGSLMLDIRQRYDFVPSSFREVKVIPNDPDMPGSSTIIYNGQTLHGSMPAGAQGGFWILAIDRLSGNVSDNYILPTNSSAAAVSDFAYLLDVYYKPHDLLIITTVGAPFSAPSFVTAGLWSAINRVGGTGFILPKLVSPSDSYTLITSTDPDYVNAHFPVESTTIRDQASTQTGELNGLLSRDKKNQFGLQTALSDQNLPNPLNSKWTEVLFQQPQDWPVWTASQKLAYLDLTAVSNHYPTVRTSLGCGGSDEICQPIRTYYDGGIGGSAQPAFLSINYNNLAYFENAQYSSADFNAVVQQLAREAGYEKNAYTLYNLFKDVTSDQSSNLQLQLQQIAQKIDESVTNDQSQLIVKRLTQAAGVAGVLSLIPTVGPAFGGLSSILYGAAVLVPSSGGVPDDGRYAFTLKQLKDGNQIVGSNLADTTASLFVSVVNDWGKVSTIGSGYAAQRSPWYMSLTTGASNIPRAALPAISLAAKQQFYLQLLPTVFSSDVFVAQPQNNPAKIGAIWKAGNIQFCNAAYAQAPSDAIQTYFSISKPSTYDIYTLTNTVMGKNPVYLFPVLNFPSSSLLTDLFSAPNLDGTSLTGGAGLLNRQLLPFPSAGYMTGRAGLKITNTSCTP
jgi:hypothetical protein